MKRKIVLAIAMAVILSTMFLAGCNEKIPDTTSTEWGLYIRSSDNVVVDRNGEPLNDYLLDKKSNIINTDRDIVIGAINTQPYIYVESITVEDMGVFSTELDTQIISEAVTVVGTGSTMPVKSVVPVEKQSRITVNVNPTSSTCATVSVKSQDDAIVSVSSPDADGLGMDGTITVSQIGGSVVFDISFHKAGDTAILITSGDGKCKANFPVSVTENPVPVNEADFREEETLPTVDTPKITNTPEASSAVTVSVSNDEIDTTMSKQAWIKGSKVNLREKANTSSNVLGTYTTGKECMILGTNTSWSKIMVDNTVGYVKSVYLSESNPSAVAATATPGPTASPAGGNVSGTSARSGTNGTASGGQAATAVVAPPASNDGGDHGYAFSNESSLAGDPNHAHDYVPKNAGATSAGSGYTEYICSCGASYRDSYSGTMATASN